MRDFTTHAVVTSQILQFVIDRDGRAFADNETKYELHDFAGGSESKYECDNCSLPLDIDKLATMVTECTECEGGSRARKVAIQIHYASVEGQTETIGAVVVPDGTTDGDIEDLFMEWRDLASGQTADPDAEDEADAYRWCEPGTDFEFLEWLVEKHGFRHSKGSGETLTLE